MGETKQKEIETDFTRQARRFFVVLPPKLGKVHFPKKQKNRDYLSNKVKTKTLQRTAESISARLLSLILFVSSPPFLHLFALIFDVNVKQKAN